jgi:transcriptional regulator with XRE-family HTH domain
MMLFGFSSASLVAGDSIFMSGKMKTKSVSSISTQSAKKRTPKTPVTQRKPEKSMTASAPVEVLSRPSSSPLSEIYRSEEFKNAWANDVRFHVAGNLLHLRRYRQMSQGAVGKAMGTSQSAVARIESAQENITLDTLQRMTNALDGRFHVSICPRELRYRREYPWWESLGGPHSLDTWNLKDVASHRDHRTENVVLWFSRGLQSGTSEGLLLDERTNTIAGVTYHGEETATTIR